MRYSAQVVLFAAIIRPMALPAQERSRFFGGVRPTLALIDNQQDATLEGVGFQMSVYFGRAFTSDVAGLVEVGVTNVSSFQGVSSPPCSYPGCSVSPSSHGNETGISLAPGFQWYTTAGARRAAFTLTPGVVWFVNRPAGTEAVAPKLGGHFDVGWLLDRGPRLGIDLGVEWWGTTGTLPRWVVPLGLTLGVR